MQPSEVKEALRAWGHATVNRFAFTKADRTTHVLSNLRDLTPQKPTAEDRELIKRDGRSRRLHMAGSLRGNVKDAKGRIQMVYVPLWACDPVPARNDADRPHDNPEVAVDQGIPDDLRWLEAAVIRIERQNPLRGLVLRTEFTVSASQKVKAHMVAETYGGKFSKDMYRSELEKAIEVICWERAMAA